MESKNIQDFYLASTDCEGFENPRKCMYLARIKGKTRDDYMLVHIDPPLIGQHYGLGDKDIYEMILASHYKDDTLFPITQFPLYVYIIRILNDDVKKNKIILENSDIEHTANGEIYKTYEDAYRATHKQ